MSYITTKINTNKVNLEIQSGTKYDYHDATQDAEGNYVYTAPTVESFDDLLARHNAEVADIVNALDLTEPANDFEF